MKLQIKKFTACESGAVTVDWVVLTAAVVGLGVVVVTTVAQGALHESRGLGAHLEAKSVGVVQ